MQATAWLEGDRIDSSKMIQEESIAMPTYDSVLTLLWIDKDIDQYVTGEDEYDPRSANPTAIGLDIDIATASEVVNALHSLESAQTG